MSIDINQYLNLVISEHNQKPKFMAWLATLLQPFVDLQNQFLSFSTAFDIDQAVGDQLDKLGLWVGISRNLPLTLPNVFFTWGTSGLGWGQGTWFGPGNQTSGLTVLPDDTYRIVLKAKIAANQWDGTVPGAYAVWQVAFAVVGFTVLIQDNQDMTMAIVFLTSTLNAVIKGLLLNGFITMRPAGVTISGYFQPSVPGTPVFGWGSSTGNVQGWGAGSWLATAAIT